MPCPYGLVIRPLFDTPKVLSFMSLLNRFAKRVRIMPCPYYGLVIWPLFGTTKVLSLNPLVSEKKSCRVLYHIGFAFGILPIACHLGQLTWVLTSVKLGYLLWWVKPTTGSN
jgi:hypothetical protein